MLSGFPQTKDIRPACRAIVQESGGRSLEQTIDPRLMPQNTTNVELFLLDAPSEVSLFWAHAKTSHMKLTNRASGMPRPQGAPIWKNPIAPSTFDKLREGQPAREHGAFATFGSSVRKLAKGGVGHERAKSRWRRWAQAKVGDQL